MLEGLRKCLGAGEPEGSGAGAEGETNAYSRGLAGGRGRGAEVIPRRWESAKLRRDHLQWV